ncbi:MAG TPA: DUF881 domain-containing protein, partial [Mycobacteriales bacterium]|nr:DUF881 domain-containing protein [Mycobacteriales bacterium]
MRAPDPPTSERRRPTSHRPKLGGMSVSLLNDLMHNTLDEGYAQAAARRAAAERAGQRPHRPGPASRVLTAAALLIVGVILGVAFRQTQQHAPASQRTRDGLARDVARQTGVSDRLQRQAESLSARLANERDSVLARSQAGDAAADRLARLEAMTGLTAVTGPGVTVTIGDAQASRRTDPVTGQPVVVPPDENGRILDRDIQSVVNALWSAGAEAITVNGERLSTTTPIRAAGDAILVDLMPVSTPYRIDAVGDPGVLLPKFADSVAARRFQTYVSAYGIAFGARRADRIRMRAATESGPHYATPTPGGEGTGPGAATDGDHSASPGVPVGP